MSDYTDRMINHQDGLNLIATLGQIRDLLGTPGVDGVYGFIEHCDTLDPASRIEYIGENVNYIPLKVDLSTGTCGLNSWASFPTITACKPWMVKSNGIGDYRLNENDYTKKLDGTTASDYANSDYDGGAFSWIMKIYKREFMMGSDRYVMFSFTKKPGFTAVGFIDPDGNELEGVWLPMLYGALVGEKLKPISGLMTDKNHNTDQEHTYITNFSSRAHFLGGGFLETLIDLLILFAKTTDLQAAYGYGNSSGYDSTDTTNYGMLANAAVGGGMFYGTSGGKALNKAFHSIVLLTQNQYMRDPYEVIVNGRVKVGLNYQYDPTGATYQDTGIDVPASEGWKYAHIYKSIPGYGSVPVVSGGKGSTSLAACDGTYTSGNQTTITTVCLRFAACSTGQNGGPRARGWDDTAGYAWWYSGAAPVLLPPVGVSA